MKYATGADLKQAPQKRIGPLKLSQNSRENVKASNFVFNNEIQPKGDICSGELLEIFTKVCLEGKKQDLVYQKQSKDTSETVNSTNTEV